MILIMQFYISKSLLNDSAVTALSMETFPQKNSYVKVKCISTAHESTLGAYCKNQKLIYTIGSVTLCSES